jgi:16S rRNA (cytosine1402-N4)-methyltransferase
MTMGGGTGEGAAGGPARHVPVLARPALEFLRVRDGGRYIDGTFGAGGHSRLMLAAGAARVVAIDRDPAAITGGAALVAASGGRLALMEEQFSALGSVARDLGIPTVDGVLLDVGVSSMQLDDAERGFSFRHDGPLDMRMGREGISAADVVAHAPERDLAAVIAVLGEEHRARAVARAIVKARAESPITTTRALADIVGRVVHARPGDIHPATRTFQALRIYVNDELGELVRALHAAERILAPGGRLAVITFHSLEDRIVKTFLAARATVRRGSRHLPDVPEAAPSFRLLTRRPVGPEEDEIAANPRARSAKLRAAERLDADPIASEPISPMARLPALSAITRGH